MSEDVEGPSEAGIERARREFEIGLALGIARRWGLTQQQLGVLLGVSRSTVSRWNTQWLRDRTVRVRTKPTIKTRIGLLLGIHFALHTLCRDTAQADSWIKRPNQGKGFNGRSALDRMLDGGIEDLRWVKTYLDGWRQ